MKTFAQVISQATASDNQLKHGLFTTKLNELVKNGDLTVSYSEEIEINGVKVNPGAVLACALEPTQKKGSDVTIESLVDLWSKGFATVLQAKSNGGTPKEVINPLSNQDRMTAEQYKNIIFRLSMDRINAEPLESIYDEFNKLSEKEKTKVNYENLLNKLFSILFPEEKREVYTLKLIEENELKKEFQSLTDLGIQEISRQGDKIVGYVPIAAMQDVLGKLVNLPYTLISANEFIQAKMSVKIMLMKVQEKETKTLE